MNPHVLPPGDATGIKKPGGPWGWGYLGQFKDILAIVKEIIANCLSSISE